MADNPKKPLSEGLELNKFAAAILFAGLLAMIAGTVARIAYHPEPAKQRGYAIEGAETPAEGEAAAVELPDPDIGTLMQKASVEEGQKVIAKCASCHDFTQGGANKVGPNLYGILGSKHGHKDDFSYSDAIKNMPGKWDYDALYHFLKKPAAYAPGTKMAFVGLKKPEDRANVIAYLRSLGGSGIALPEAKAQPQAAVDGNAAKTEHDKGAEVQKSDSPSAPARPSSNATESGATGSQPQKALPGKPAANSK